MSGKTVDYYFTPMSPWTYFGHARFVAMAKRHEARVTFKPISLGKVFPVSGGLPLAKRAPQRQAYRLVELQRWKNYLGVPLVIHPKFFPVDDNLASRMIVAVQASGEDPASLSLAFHRLIWVEDGDAADPATCEATATKAGYDGARLRIQAETDKIKAAFDANTQEAIDRNVFGAPSYVVEGEIFWGQDRLDFVERALAAR